jgi:hypothetical protein
MKQNRDHSKSIDLTPTLSDMVPLENDTTPVTVEFAISGKVGEQAVPIFARNQVLRDKERMAPVDLSKLDPSVKALLVKREQQILAWYDQKKQQQADTSGISPQSVGSVVLLSPWDYGVVTYETINELWHPVVVIDSEPGLTHTFTLSLYTSSGKSFQLSSNMQIQGVAANVAYGISYSASFAIAFDPITCSGGQVNTYRSSFRHVYQEGDLYHYYWFVGWVHVGGFKREYVDTWYQASFERVNYGQLSEVRDDYLGEWRSNTGATMTMTNGVGTSWTGGIGVTVGRQDVFGAGAQISITYSYNFGTTAVHRFDYTMPGSGYYVDFYSGRAFEINTYQYHTGPWQ